MYLQGVLIEAKDLVNDRSIVQASKVDSVTYIHIELETHDVIIAEGSFSETFVDDDSRAMFHNAHEYRQIYADEPRRTARYYAPRLRDGYQVEAARRYIDALAGLRQDTPETTSLRGFVDVVAPKLISGWAQNPEHPAVPVCLEIVADGRVIGEVLANLHRPDLERRRARQRPAWLRVHATVGENVPPCRSAACAGRRSAPERCKFAASGKGHAKARLEAIGGKAALAD